MPAPTPQSRSSSTTMIIIGFLSAIIILTFAAFFFYLRRKRGNRLSNNISDPEARRLSQVTGETERPNSHAETNSDRTQIGFKIVGRLPRLETINTPIRSIHPSVHNASPTRSNSQPPLPTLGRRSSDPEERLTNHVAMEGSRAHFFERKNRQRRKKFSGQSLDSKIDQNPSLLQPPAIIELRRASVESIEHMEKNSQVYSPYNEQGSSTKSLLEMSPRKYDTCPPSAGSATAFINLSATDSHHHLEPIDNKSPDLRITASSIVETTEKKPPARILRKKLLNLISTQPRPGLRNESEEKYYWEMMQVETNETWWQLPFPPHLSPIKSEFELSDLDLHQHQPDSPGPYSHPETDCEAHPQGMRLVPLQSP